MLLWEGNGGDTSGGAQGLVLALCSLVKPGGAQKPYTVKEIEPEPVIIFKARAFITHPCTFSRKWVEQKRKHKSYFPLA